MNAPDRIGFHAFRVAPHTVERRMSSVSVMTDLSGICVIKTKLSLRTQTKESMPGLVDVMLNIAAGVVTSILIATTVWADWVKFVAISYGVIFVVLLFVPDGGQVNAGLAGGLLAYAVLGFVGMDKDLPGYLIQQREKVTIFEGIMSAKANVGKTYNTYDPTSGSYKRLPKSINRMGGAQFSYSFWLMFERGVSNESVEGKTILMRGDKQHFQPLVSTAGEPDTASKNLFERGKDYTIACPRISFVKANQLAVDVNTDRELRTRFIIGSDEESVEMRKNLLSLVPGHFALLTFVFEDNVGIDSFEKGIRMKFYMNDLLYHTSTAPGALRQNTGPLHLFLDAEPSGTQGIDHCKLADLTYYNYALEDRDVAGLYGKGFTNSEFKDQHSIYSKDVRLHAGAANRMDLTNYNDELHSYPSTQSPVSRSS